MNGNAVKPATDQFAFSRPAKGGAEENGSAPLTSPSETGGFTECPAQDVSPGALVSTPPLFIF